MAPPESESSDATIVAGVPAVRSFASGRYVVRRVLPEGAQKTVYVVHDTALDRDCALALIKTELLEADDLERVRREARAMARLDHPNIVAVHDIGEEGGRPFFVCQYISGGDLREELREARGPLALERALSIAEDLCRALGHAHEHDVVHRDLKPANIWLTSDGAVKLGDFGLATAGDHSRITLAGTFVGTATYMAPEQAMGQPADARSDLYALGCILYEMFTGRPPFLGDDAVAVISQHIHTAPVAPSWHNPQVSKPLEALTLRLLAKSPSDRVGSAQDVAMELRRIVARPALEPPSPAPPQPLNDLRGLNWGFFVGRNEEMDALKDVLGHALSGKGSLVMLVGEPGIGKTRLAEEFGVYAGLRGAQVLTGHCYEGEASLPYRPFVEAFRQYTRSRPDGELRTQLGPGAPEIAALVSEIRARFPDIEEAPKLEPEGERMRLFESVTEFLRNASTAQPLVLHLDDLHWADKPSLLLLQHLMQQTARERLLVLGTYRDAELARTHPLSETLGALRRLPNFRRVLLRGLHQESVVDLLAIIDPSEEGASVREALAAALYQETEGNPFFIREVLTHLIETGKIVHEGGRWVGKVTSIAELGIPEGVREVIGRRFSRLSEGCNRMLTVTSTMTGGFSWEVLKAINADVPEAQLLDLLEEALGAQLIAERKGERGTYDFTHALIRQTSYEELSTPRRILLHRQIGEALEQLYAGNIDRHLPELAHHFYQAAPGGDVERAVDYSRRAGNRATTRFGYEEAALDYGRALQALEMSPQPDGSARGDLLIALGLSHMDAGEVETAKATFRQAAEVARRSNDAGRFAQAAIGFAREWNAAAVDATSVALLEEALDWLPAGNSALRSQALSSLARALYFSNEPEQKERLTHDAVEMARQSGDPGALASALSSRHFVLSSVERVDERLAAATELLHLARDLGDVSMLMEGHAWRIADYMEIGDADAARLEVAAALPLAKEFRRPQYIWYAAVFTAMDALLTGAFAEADVLAMQALTAGQRLMTEAAMQVYGAQLFALRWVQGRLSEVEPVFKSLSTQFPGLSVFRIATAFLDSELEREDEARAAFEELAAHDFLDLPRDLGWMMSISLLAQVAVFLRDLPRAEKLYALMAPFADRNVAAASAVACNGSASRYLGQLATALKRYDDAQRHFDDAIEMNARMGALPFVAYTRYDFAAMLLRRGEPADREAALGLLNTAVDSAERLGMKALIENCQALQAEVDDIERSSV